MPAVAGKGLTKVSRLSIIEGISQRDIPGETEATSAW
jgi:hypothetical protein